MSKPNCFSICMLLLFMELGSMIPFGETRSIPFDEFPCMTIDSRAQARAGRIPARYRWKIFKVYVEDSFSSGERAMIHEALQKLREILPCVTVEVPDSRPDGDYVHVTGYEYGCYSTSLGRAAGRQDVNLGSGCRNNRTIMHEFFHALGIHHEHNRVDRDEYVTIYWENIVEGYEYQFEKVSEDDFSNFGVPYNIRSIMHYPSYAFSWNKEKPTILKKDGSEIELQIILQDTDILKLQRMYGCSGEYM